MKTFLISLADLLEKHKILINACDDDIYLTEHQELNERLDQICEVEFDTHIKPQNQIDGIRNIVKTIT
jgi:hypothetical protein